MKSRDVLLNSAEFLPVHWHKSKKLANPSIQQDALCGPPSEIGISAATIAVECPEGLVLMDGHLRSEIVGYEILPVLNVDLNDDEADKLLTTFNSVSGMATADPENLEQLLSEMSNETEAAREMIDKMAADNCLRSHDLPPRASEITQGLLTQK